MLLKNTGEVRAIMGCGQYNMVVEVGETKDIPEPLVEMFKLRFPALINADIEPPPDTVKPESVSEDESSEPSFIKKGRGRPRKGGKDE